MHISIYLAYSILLNFLIYSQSTAKTGNSIAVIGTFREGACHKENNINDKISIGGKVGISSRVSIGGRVGINDRVGIGGKVGIRASSSKDVFRLFRVPLLLYRALSIIYSGEVNR